MEASCYLGESSYEILQDDISSSATVKVPSTHRVDLSRADIFDRVVFEDSTEIEQLCNSCLESLSNILSQSEKTYLNHSSQYEQAARQIAHSDRDQFDEEHAKGLIDDILEAERECKRLVQEDHNHTLQVNALQREIAELDGQLHESTMALNSLDYSSEEAQESLMKLMSVTVTAEIELEHLSRNPASSVFSFQWVDLSPHEPGSSQHRRLLTRADKMLAVNGLRVAFAPLSTENLNWAEICAAWSCLCSAIVCCQNEESLVAGGADSGDGSSSHADSGRYNSYSYGIVCLRDFAIFVRQSQRVDWWRERRSRDDSATTAPPEYYELQCSQRCDLVMTFVDGEGCRGVGEEYVKALVALAIVVVEMTEFGHRPDVLSGKCQLQGLLQLLAGDWDKSGDPTHHRTVFNWPPMDTIVSSMFKSISACVELVDELMEVIPALLNIDL